MSSLPESLVHLVSALGKLPGIGPRSAERIALHLVQGEPEQARQLADAVVGARQKIEPCRICGALTERQPCSLCDDPRRDDTLLCVVEQPVDIYPLEKSGAFHGRYHVLGGKISPLDGIEPEDLRIAELEARLRARQIREVIVALATDVEGDATGHYLAQRLASLGVKVTRLAYGLPAGTGLEYADGLTLSRALEGRRELKGG
jgi:recombination protein RecR